MWYAYKVHNVLEREHINAASSGLHIQLCDAYRTSSVLPQDAQIKAHMHWKVGYTIHSWLALCLQVLLSVANECYVCSPVQYGVLTGDGA